MYIEKRPTSFKFTERYKGLDGKYHSKSVSFSKNNFKTRTEAQSILDKRIKNELTNIPQIRVSDLIDKYITSSNITERSKINYYSSFKGIIDLLKDPMISELNCGYILDCFDAINNNICKYNRYMLLLKMLLNWAFLRNYIDADISKKLRILPESHTHEVSDKYLEPEELGVLLDYMKKKCNYEYLICKLMALTGMRIGEVLALKKDDISEDYIKIDETYDKTRKAFDDPKSTIRSIYIQNELRDFLTELKNLRDIRLNLIPSVSTDLIFFDDSGEPYSYNIVYKKIVKYSNEVLGRKLSPHVFRHTHISLLAAEGVPLETISRRVGHKNSNITKTIYLHVTNKMREKDNNAIKNIYIVPKIPPKT